MPKQKGNRSAKQKRTQLARTQECLNLKRFLPLGIGDGDASCIEGDDGKVYVYLSLRPDNISVLGRSEVLSRIHNLQIVLQETQQLEFLCISSSQTYEANKRYYRKMAEAAQNSIIARLCQMEIDYLEEINRSMSTSREFYVVLCYRADRLDEARHSIAQVAQLLKEYRFHARAATADELKRLHAIYYVGDIYNERIPEYDGAQYMMKEV